MSEVEPRNTGDTGLSLGVVTAVVVGALALLAVVVFLLFSVFDGETDSATTIPAAAATTAPEPEPTTTPPVPTTTTAPPPTTTTASEPVSPFVGWWKATDADGSHLDVRVSEDGSFHHWDSSNGPCGEVPATWIGTAAIDDVVAIMTASGVKTCFPYGAENEVIGEPEFEFDYLAESDTMVFRLDGTVYSRSDEVSGIAGDPTNPLVGTWEATDLDGTRVVMWVEPDGTWSSVDTRSGGCERKGFTFATWSGEGAGNFALDETTPTFDVVFNTFCHPPGEDAVVHTEEANFLFTYDTARDEVSLDAFGTVYTRLP